MQVVPVLPLSKILWKQVLCIMHILTLLDKQTIWLKCHACQIAPAFTCGLIASCFVKYFLCSLDLSWIEAKEEEHVPMAVPKQWPFICDLVTVTCSTTRISTQFCQNQPPKFNVHILFHMQNLCPCSLFHSWPAWLAFRCMLNNACSQAIALLDD